MSKITYISFDEIIQIHEQLILKFGGSYGIRDKGLLESCLHRPQSGYYTTLSLQAASLLEGLTLNHCFMDGNKRVALVACVLFLKLNGITVKIPSPNFSDFIINEVIIKKVGVEKIAKWLEQYFSM